MSTSTAASILAVSDVVETLREQDIDHPSATAAIDLIHLLHAQNVTLRTARALINTTSMIEGLPAIMVSSKRVSDSIKDDLHPVASFDPRISTVLARLADSPRLIPQFQALNMVASATTLDDDPYRWGCTDLVANTIISWQEQSYARSGATPKAKLPTSGPLDDMRAIAASLPEPVEQVDIMISVMEKAVADDPDCEAPLGFLCDGLRQRIGMNIW